MSHTNAFRPTDLADAATLLAARIFSGGKPSSAAAPLTSIPVVVGDETTALTVGAAKVTFRAPYTFTLRAVRASITTAPTGATKLTVDVKLNGVSVFSTTLTFDASAKTTVGATVPAVISTRTFPDDGEVKIDIVSVGSTVAGAGLKVTLLVATA